MKFVNQKQIKDFLYKRGLSEQQKVFRPIGYD